MEPVESPPVHHPEPSADDRNMAMVAHLSSFAIMVFPAFGNIIGPLVVWLIYKEKSEYVAYHAREALNFQITVTIAMIISGILAIVAIGFIFLAVVGIASLVFTIIAAIRASEGERYRYPWKLKFVN